MHVFSLRNSFCVDIPNFGKYLILSFFFCFNEFFIIDFMIFHLDKIVRI